MIKNIVLIVIAVILTLAVQAGLGVFSNTGYVSKEAEAIANAQTEVKPAPKTVEEAAQYTFAMINPRYAVESVTASAIKDLYRVETKQGLTAYMDVTGEFLLTGNLLQVKDGQVVNLTEKAKEGKRKALLATLNPDEMIVFPADGEAKAHITVFTDIDCGFCRKLHLEVPALNAAGVEVRYMGFPRAGVGSNPYKKLVTAWCSDDSAAALTTLKQGGSLESVQCENPIAEQYQMGQRLGVNGTPAIFLDDGELIPGYRPAASLIETLQL